MIEPLASSDPFRSQSRTNLSRSISLSIVDQDENEISISTPLNNSYRFVIPHDPSVMIPPMSLQNVTSMNSTPHHLLFNLHYVSLSSSEDVSVSIHLEVRSLNMSLGYLLIYKFDTSPQLNSSISDIDGWSILCPSPSNESIYTYFINNQLTMNHQSLIFGIRELNSTEVTNSCSNRTRNQSIPISDIPFAFTSNYEIRVYTSGCYYLSEENQWKSDGLLVSVFI